MMSRLIRAVSAGEAFLARLRQGSFQGKVHSVFHRVCNLTCGEGTLYSLFIPNIGNSPNGLVVSLCSGEDFHSVPISQDDNFNTIGLNTLFVGPLVVDLNEISVWSAVEPASRISTAMMVENLGILKKLAGSAYAPEGLSWLLSNPCSDRPVFANIRQNVLALTQAVHCRNYPDIQKAAAGIIGFGPGLTPAGDDFLAGFMLGLYWGRKAHGMDAGDFERCNEQIVITAKARTHLISYTQLLFAARGQAIEPVHDLLVALYFQSGGEMLRAAASRVLGLGSTSGSDIITGIVTAMDFVLLGQQPAYL